MIKGAQKRMIVMKTADSAVFEEAYFVLRRENECKDADMVAEANRIIESSGGKKKRRFSLREQIWYVVSFCVGAAFGGGLSLVVFLCT